MSKFKYVIVVILFIVYGCHNKSLRSDIIKSAEDHFKNQSADSVFVYDIGSYIDFDWDTLYVFGEYTTTEEISSELGFDCSCPIVGDSKQRMIFTKDKEIVYTENANIRNEDFKLQFIPKDWKVGGHLKYSKFDTLFFISRDYTNDGRIFYNLFPQKIE
jgi:hypothetical protein